MGVVNVVFAIRADEVYSSDVICNCRTLYFGNYITAVEDEARCVFADCFASTYPFGVIRICRADSADDVPRKLIIQVIRVYVKSCACRFSDCVVSEW